MIDFDNYTDREIRLAFAIGILILLGGLIALGTIIHNQEIDSYNRAVKECGGADNVVQKFNPVDQITYYTCSK